MCLSNLLRQPHRRAKVPVLAHDDGVFILSLIGGPHQVQSQADIHSFLLTSGVHPAPVDVNSPAPQIPDLVRPEAVPEQLRRACQRIGHACIEAYADKGATGVPGGQDVRQLLNVVARPSIGRPGPRGPRPPGEVIEVLAVDEYEGTHTKKHPPRDMAEATIQRAGKNLT